MKLTLEFETTEELKQLLLLLCQQNNIKAEPDRSAVNKIKDRIKERDENCCVLCKSDENLVVHHIFNFKEYPDLRTEESNLVTLCRKHHKRLHSEFGNNVTLNEFEEFIYNHYEYRSLLLDKLDEYNIDFTETFIADINSNNILEWLNNNNYYISHNQDDKLISKDIYNEFIAWFTENKNGLLPSINKFYKVLNSLGIVETNKPTHINGKTQRCIIGISKLTL